jgi:putative two-component system response regulator
MWTSHNNMNANSEETPKPRILIVEDEPSVAMTMRFLLGLAGCEAEIAYTGVKAIQMAQANHYDLITLDVIMPDMNGFDLCCKIKGDPRLRDIPIVFVSGQCSLEDQQHGLNAGSADYITKPFQTFEFARRLLSHIGQKEEIDLLK